MITYIYLKDSTLMAFEGPEKRVKKDILNDDEFVFVTDLANWKEAMSTARESALPVVNYIDVAILIGDRAYSITISTQIEFKTEPVALPGWGLEKVWQWKDPFGNEYFDCKETGEVFDRTNQNHREAYRLKRSEPENSAHGYTKLYEESGIITESQFIELNRVEPSESQEDLLNELSLLILYNTTDKEILEKFTITRK